MTLASKCSRSVSDITSRYIAPGWMKSVSSLWAWYAERTNLAGELVGRIGVEDRVSLGATVGVGCVDRVAAWKKVHVAVLAVAMHRDQRLIDRQLEVVGADAIAVGVGVAEKPALEHLVWTRGDARHHVGWLERRLLDLSEVVVRVPVENLSLI